MKRHSSKLKYLLPPFATSEKGNVGTESTAHKSEAHLSPESDLVWEQLATIAYSWSDQRDPDIDKAWWKTIGLQYPRLIPTDTAVPCPSALHLQKNVQTKSERELETA